MVAGKRVPVRWIRWSLIGGFMVMVMLAGLAWAMTGPLGRAVLISVADGRSVAGYGVVRLAAVEGDVLSRFTIGRIEIRDRDGPWLIAEQTQIQWRFHSAFSDTIEIEAIQADAIEVLRRPIRDAAEQRGGGRAPAIRLEQLTLEHIRLAQGVAGPAADYALEARLARSADGALTASGNAARIDQAGDRADFDLARSGDGVLSGDISITAPPGGALAALLQSGPSGWMLDGHLTGTVRAGAGDYQLRLGDGAASAGRLSWSDGTWALEASLRPAAWPAFPERFEALAADVALQGHGRLSPLTIAALEARSDALILDAADLLSERWRADIILTERGASLADAYGVGLSAARAQLRPVRAGPGSVHALSLELAGMSYGQIRAETLVAEVGIQAMAEGYRLQPGGRLEGLAVADPRLSALVGDHAAFDAVVMIAGRDQRVTVEHAAAQGEGWRAEAEGVWAAGPGRVTGAAQLDILDVQALDLGVSGALSISARSSGGADQDRLTLTAQSPGLTGPGALARVLGRVEAQAQLDLRSSGINLPVIRIQTDALALEGQAAQSAEDRSWAASGDGLFDLSAVQADGLNGEAAMAFELSADAQGVALRSQTQTAELTFGETLITAPVLRTEARVLEGGVAGIWRIDAAIEGQTALLDGRFIVEGDQAELTVATAQWGSMRATGAVQRSNDRLSANLVAADATAGRSWTTEFAYAGALSNLFEGELTGRVEAQDWTLPGGYLSSGRIEVDGPLSALPVRARANGLLIDPFMLDATGELALSQSGAALYSDLEGHWNNRPISVTEPIRVTADPDGLSLLADLTLGEARIALRASREAGTRASLTIADAPAEGLSALIGLPPSSGQWGLDADLERRDGIWRGDLIARLDQVQPRDRQADGALNGEARLALGDRVRFDLQATAGALEAQARLQRPDPIENLGTLLDPGWRGSVDIQGEMDTLAQLYLSSSEQFSGLIEGHAQFGEGAVSGFVEMSEGAFSSQTAGVRLSPFTLSADFSDDQLHIREARLGDGAGGGAMASGAVGFTEDGLIGAGQIQFERFNAVSRPDLSVQATGHAQLDLQGRRLRITGESNLDQLRLIPAPASGRTIPQIEVEEVNRPETLDPPYRRPILIELDYTLRADDSLFVSSRAFNSEWSADVHVEGLLNRLTLDGAATLRSGQASLLTRVFRLQEGRLSFAGPISRTRILLEGRHERAGLDVTARAEGVVTQPRISFESHPSLPEDEVLARLLFDQDAGALSPLQAAQLAAQLSGRNWLGALGEAGRRLGVDRLDVREGESGQLAVVGGRRLGRDVYLELETSAATALGSARIEWSITPDIIVLSRLTGDTDAQLGVRWRREFD